MTGNQILDSLYFDVVILDGDKKYAFNDYTYSQEESAKYFAKATLKPCVAVDKGTAVIDGEKDQVYTDKGTEVTLSIRNGAKAAAMASLLWDDSFLYVYVAVTDSDLNRDHADAYQHDSLEVFIDEDNGKTSQLDADDKQYRIDYENEQTFNGQKCNAENMKSVSKITESGYVIEAAFKWTDITPKKLDRIGLDLQINDADSTGKRIGTLNWNDASGMGWSKSEVFGTIMLKDSTEVSTAPTTPTPAPSVVPAPAPAVDKEQETVIVPITYVVQKGDSLSKIARRNGTTVRELLNLNPEIKNPNRIYVGQVLVVGNTGKESTAEENAQRQFYIVQRGDSLYKIARRNKTTLNRLYQLNPELRRQKFIFRGQKIRVK